MHYMVNNHAGAVGNNPQNILNSNVPAPIVAPVAAVGDRNGAAA